MKSESPNIDVVHLIIFKKGIKKFSFLEKLLYLS